MPSYTEEQKEAALKALEECGGSVTRVIRRLGYPSRQALCQWINQADASHVRTAGRPWSRYDPALKREAVRLAAEGVAGEDVADALGASSAAVVYNWARKGASASGKADAVPIAPVDDDAHAYDGFAGCEADRIRQLELENDILREVVARLKGGGLGEMTNREKTQVIDSLRRKTGRSLKEPTASLRISRSPYEHRHAAIARGDKHGAVRQKAAEAFEAANRSRGCRHVAHELRVLDEPVVASEKAVRRIMSEEGRRVIYRKRARRCGSYKGEVSDAPPNLVQRAFRSGLPNSLWLTDATEFAIPAGKVCLSPVLDCFDGALPAWSISTAPDAELANSMLRAACATLSPGERPVIHDDRGRHCRWPGWMPICEEHGLVRSMSAKGCTPDNSAMEGFFGRLKNEFFYGREWAGVSVDEFMSMLDACLVYYNEGRAKESLGRLSPMQFRKSLGLAA